MTTLVPALRKRHENTLLLVQNDGSILKAIMLEYKKEAQSHNFFIFHKHLKSKQDNEAFLNLATNQKLLVLSCFSK